MLLLGLPALPTFAQEFIDDKDVIVGPAVNAGDPRFEPNANADLQNAFTQIEQLEAEGWDKKPNSISEFFKEYLESTGPNKAYALQRLGQIAGRFRESIATVNKAPNGPI